MSIVVAGALPVWKNFQIVEESVFDLIYASGASGDVLLQGVTHTGATIPTVTTNTDMRGTDSAATAANLATVDSNVDAILVDTGTTIPDQLDSMSGATFSTSTDSLEAIRNRGDTACTTGSGGSSATVEQIRFEMVDN